MTALMERLHTLQAVSFLEKYFKSAGLEAYGVKLAGAILLSVAAYTGNALNVDLFFGVNYLFGSIFVWLALMTIGPLGAIFVAATSALYTVELWGHWYAVLLFTLEATAVALMRGYSRPAWIAPYVLLYWLFVGAPLALLSYSYGLELPWTTVQLVVAKQVLNALVNVSIAVFLLNITLLLFPSAASTIGTRVRSSYGNLLQATFGLLMLIPISLSEFFELNQRFSEQTQSLQERAKGNAGRSAHSTASFLELETNYWRQYIRRAGKALSPRDFALAKAKDESAFPVMIYRVTLQGDWKLLYGEKEFNQQQLTDLVKAAVSRNATQAHMLGCWSGMIFTASKRIDRTGFLVFGWAPADLSILVSEEPGMEVAIRCQSSDGLQAGDFETLPTVEIVRDLEVGVASLVSWQHGYVRSRAALSAARPFSLELVFPLGPTVLAIQKGTSRAIVRLCFLAILIIAGGYVLEVLFRRWVEHFVVAAETFLRFQKPPSDGLNYNFYENREISKWLGRFSRAVASEERSKILAINNFEKLVRRSSMPIFAADQGGRIVEWNPALEKMTGHRRDEVIGTSLSDLAENSLEIELQLSSSEEALFDVHIRSKSGSLVHLEASQAILTELSDLVLTSHSEQPHSMGIVKFFIARNLNDFMDTQAKLIQASRLAALGEMASSFAHELNQPLNIIAISAGNCLERIKFEEISPTYVISKMRRIEEQALRAGRVIQGIRQFVLEIGDEQVVTFDPTIRIQSAISLLHEQLRLDSVVIKQNVPETSQHIVGRPILFEQTLVNLLTNARQAMINTPRDERIIQINLESDGSEISITVADNGPGIPSELLDRVFDPFFTTKGETSGTGIGLYLSKTVVEAMHGSIHAEACLDGARIIIKFPVACEESNVRC